MAQKTRQRKDLPFWGPTDGLQHLERLWSYDLLALYKSIYYYY